MAEYTDAVLSNRLLRRTQIAHYVLLAVVALGALCSIPLVFGHHSTPDEADSSHHTVAVLFAGLAVALSTAALAIKRTPFREHRGSAMTDDERIAELEAQFEAEGRGR